MKHPESVITKKKIKWDFSNSSGLLRWDGVHTVCEESVCPNRAECSQLNTATFLIGGKYCTRNCLFCRVEHGRPPSLNDIRDIEKNEIFEAVKKLGLKFVVITSVTRDDDPEGLARHFQDICVGLKKMGLGVELLIPDFHRDVALLELIASAAPDVIAHNIETVSRLSPDIRPQASYKKSMEVLQYYIQHYPKIMVKSGFMLGLGETMHEIKETLTDLKLAGVNMVTIGQYLRPGTEQAPVEKYYTEQDFAEIKQLALETGIRQVEAGFFTRSSFRAVEMFSGETARPLFDEKYMDKKA